GHDTLVCCFFFQAEDGIRDFHVTGVQTCALPISIQNAAFRAAGADGVYVALRCTAETLPGLMRGIALAGGGGNVTVPHKEAARRVLDHAAAGAARTGACNTFWYEAGALCGDNTDVAGFRAAARELVPTTAGARVLLLGAGGAARAALAALEEEGGAAVTVLARTPSRAQELKDRLGATGLAIHVATSAADVRGQDFDLVVNATPLGLRPGDPLPLGLSPLGSAGAVLDMVYGTEPTPWVASARALGIPAVDGIPMLIAQGAAAFERWWGVPAPVDAMRAALSVLAR